MMNSLNYLLIESRSSKQSYEYYSLGRYFHLTSLTFIGIARRISLNASISEAGSFQTYCFNRFRDNSLFSTLGKHYSNY